MGQVSVTVNGRQYDVGCDDGQEDRLRQLVDYVDGRMCEMVEAVGQIGEARLLLMASLLLADELSDARAELEIRREAPVDGTEAAADHVRDAIGAEIEALADRIEVIAARLNPA
jgi:cell division protein ZapA